jgi:hypothetical protein
MSKTQDILAKAQANIDAAKAKTAAAVEPADQVVREVSQTAKQFEPKLTLTFWCSMPNQVVHTERLKVLQFRQHELKLTNSDEIVQLRSLVRNFPAKFKELG